ncbi:uncharacterized protein LOC111050577 isoform X2 [Nilaparvata lugens]|uniref:uncharacterized protein LOC111050577 isoform X2 n=1 Tax=Nilaparvata lugens TaxID=108931 RepID=UPI00193C9AF0|nr:uncharacterized protein LOC111050577 isoform X2 [Nilaparvata lugens]
MLLSRELIVLITAISMFTSTYGQINRRIIKQKVRNNNKFFVRLTIKNNIFPDSILLAYGAGYRINWDMNPSPRSARSLTSFKHQFISAMQQILDRETLNSEKCLLRAACEVDSLDLKNGDIIDKILHAIFRTRLEEGTCNSSLNLQTECRLSLVNLAGYILENVFVGKI